MKKTVTFLAILSLVSCATQTERKKEKTDDKITNEDFKKAVEVRFNKNDDYFSAVNSDATSALNDESLERVVMYDGDIEYKNPVSKIAKNCYERKFKDAFIQIKNISKEYSKNAIFWNQVGTCYLLKNERRKALLFFNKALDLKRDYVPALNNLGVMYFRERDYERALVAFERAIKASEFSKTPRYNIANLYLHFGLAEKSLKYSLPLYSVSKTDVDVLNMVGAAYLMSNQAEKALSFYSQISGNYRESAGVALNYSLALFGSGNKGKARDIFEDIDKKTIKELAPYYKRVGKTLGVTK